MNQIAIFCLILLLGFQAEIEPRTEPLIEEQTGIQPITHANIGFNNTEMVLVKGGSFMMGNQGPTAKDEEEPLHKVTISDFYLGAHEVTFAQYDKFCEATGRGKPGDEGWGRQNRPVIHVSWDDARAYTRWLSKNSRYTYRLPSEAEWEYAAGGGNGERTEYSGTNDVDELYQYANFCDINCGHSMLMDEETDDQFEFTAPVKSYKPNVLGLYDMTGNVSEWCEDWYHENYENAPRDGSPWISPVGIYRVFRGESFMQFSFNCFVAGRAKTSPEIMGFTMGFRVARSL